MKRTALDPTFENILESIEENRFGKNEDIVSFIKMMKNTEGAFNIALDGGWGTGKTFFIKQTKMAMDFLSGQYKEDYDLEEQSKIEKLFSESSIVKDLIKDFGQESCRTVYFDAWDHDSDEDPIGSLAYELALCGNGIDTTRIDAFNVLKELISFKINLDISGFIAHDDLIEKIKSERNVRKEIEKKIDDIIGERADRIVIFIDELDRCNPAYAVRLLERIKHYFNHEKILFVFVLNADQLQHTIKAYYGSEFQGIGYLDKFFDLWLPMPEIEYDNVLKNIKGRVNSTIVVVAHNVMQYLQLSFREIEKYLQEVRVMSGEIQSQAIYANIRVVVYQYICLFMIGLKTKNISLFYNVLNGKSPETIINFLMQGNMKKNIQMFFEFKTEDEMKEGLEALYSLLFITEKEIIVDQKDTLFYKELSSLSLYISDAKRTLEKMLNLNIH